MRPNTVSSRGSSATRPRYARAGGCASQRRERQRQTDQQGGQSEQMRPSHCEHGAICRRTSTCPPQMHRACSARARLQEPQIKFPRRNTLRASHQSGLLSRGPAFRQTAVGPPDSSRSHRMGATWYHLELRQVIGDAADRPGAQPRYELGQVELPDLIRP
jgi:hypothetical protein